MSCRASTKVAQRAVDAADAAVVDRPSYLQLEAPHAAGITRGRSVLQKAGARLRLRKASTGVDIRLRGSYVIEHAGLRQKVQSLL